jgi:rhodanese-related sulfurtransferase
MGAEEGFRKVHVADVATMLDSADHAMVVLDANKPDFREREGIVPGATLLSSYSAYDVAKELPARKDAALVFYCANSH